MMIYIYDILLNFCDCDMIYDFFEWNQNDTVENIKKIKLAYIDQEKFDDIYKYDGNINATFLEKIYHTCEVYTKKKIKTLDYCVLLSDGERVIAVEFDKDGEPIYKSKLLLDEEEEIALLATNLEKYPVTYNKKSKILNERFYTRNEMAIKNYLIKEITDAYKTKKHKKLKFVYQEYFDEQINSYEIMYKKLIESLKNVIDEKHNNIYQLLRITNRKKQV